MDRIRIVYEVMEIKGTCPIYKLGDKIVIDQQYPTEVINLEESSAVCMRVMNTMWSNLLYQCGSDDLRTYFGSGTAEYHIACEMPGEPYTSCGFVVFRIRREVLNRGGKAK